jgi:FkbM family methyltransferase
VFRVISNKLVKLIPVEIDGVIFYATSISDFYEQLRIDFEKQSFEYIINSLHNCLCNVDKWRKWCFFIDVGANIGRYSLYLAKKFPNTLVIAIEPDPEAYLALIKGVQANSLNNVIALNLAAYNSNGYVVLSRKRSSTISSIVNRTNTFEMVKVRAMRIDDLVKKLNMNSIDIVKIDVEGAELYVLQGFEESIKKFKPRIIIEVTKRNKEDVIKFFTKVGYNCKSIIKNLATEYFACQAHEFNK